MSGIRLIDERREEKVHTENVPDNIRGNETGVTTSNQNHSSSRMIKTRKSDVMHEWHRTEILHF
jgi:hypothetical protein